MKKDINNARSELKAVILMIAVVFPILLGSLLIFVDAFVVNQ